MMYLQTYEKTPEKSFTFNTEEDDLTFKPRNTEQSHEKKLS